MKRKKKVEKRQWAVRRFKRKSSDKQNIATCTGKVIGHC